MAQIKDELLFQVKLLPPQAGNVKSVSQVLDQSTQAQKRNTRAKEESRQKTQQVEEQLEEYAIQLTTLRENMRRAEEGARFYDESTESATQSIAEQVAEVKRLRANIDGMEAEVESTGASMKKFQRIQRRATAAVKGGNLGISRLDNNFGSMSGVASRANQTLMDFGRIIQDLPFGIIGVSNNIAPLGEGFTRLKQKAGGTGAALKKLMSQFMGSGGLLFLVGSAIPAALTVATQGFIGFDRIMGSSSETAEDLEGNLKSVSDAVKELRDTGGDDPLGTFDAEAQLRGIKDMVASVQGIIDKRERINSLEKASMGFKESGVKIYDEEIQRLEDQIDAQLDRLDLSEEQVEKLQAQEKSLEAQLKSLSAMGKLSGDQVFHVAQLDKANTMIDRFNQGIREVGGVRTTDALKQQRKNLNRLVKSWQLMAENGDENVLPFIRAANGILDDINSTLDEIPEKEFLVPEIPEDEIIPADLSEQTIELDFEIPDKIPFGRDSKEGRKFLSQLSEQTFKIRQEMADDRVALEMSTQRQLAEIEHRANELGLNNEREVQQAKTAIRRRYAKKRQEIELQREQELADRKRNMVSATADFIGSVNGALAEESQVLAIAQLALQKGLKIAEVQTEGARRIFELEAMAQKASAQAGMAFATGNVVKGGMMSAQVAKIRGQIAQVKTMMGATTAMIAGAGLAEAVGTVTGGGSGGSGGGSGGSGSSRDRESGSAFAVTEKNPSNRSALGMSEDEAMLRKIAEKTDMVSERDVEVFLEFYGELNEEMLSVKAKKGQDKREQGSIRVKSN